jgi:hypothetical protein
VRSFQPFSTPPFATPLGQNTTTISANSASGRYYPANGGLVLDMNLQFDHSMDVFFLIEDSSLPITLTTNDITSPFGYMPGNEVDAAGTAQLVGQSTFVDGILGGSIGALGISGTFTAL